MTEPPFDAFRYAHAHRDSIVWMSQNTNHLVPPAIVREAVEAALRERRYEGYPYAAGLPELAERVTQDLGMPADTQVQISAGGTEALYMLTRALLSSGDEVIASDPSYLIIHKFIELCGARTKNLDIYAAPYRLTAERIQAAIGPKTRMILLIDPLNPLGSGYPASEVRAIAEIARDHKLWLLNDVTYRDFADAPALAFWTAPEQTLTVWSVSKNCGMAGLRLGGLIGRPELVRAVARYNTNDLGVNILAQVAALAALRSKGDWIGPVRSTTRANQERIRSVIAGVEGTSLPVFPSQANMFVIDLAAAGVAPEPLQKELLVRHGVFLRAGSYLSPQFGSRFIRASFSNLPADIERFASAFPEAVDALRPTVRPPAPPA
ncbi:MAG TPA: pyridoxal phosphate-dependent aminotransferase [Thermoplasmata archaeon]|nr:pyridoxal phosphate-dependent aminotransferase [Thermoplasmata archaeon]